MLKTFFYGLLVGILGTLSGETTLDESIRISKELTEISKEYNEIVISSQLTLQDLQEILPSLQKRVGELKIEVAGLMKDSLLLTETSDSLLLKWTNLNNSISVLSTSVETLGMSLSILEESVKRAQRRNSAGLVISIIAGCGVTALIGLEVYQAFK